MNEKILKRGFDEIIPPEEFEKRLERDQPLRVKFGADPTGSQLHLGHAVIFNKLRQFQEAGHTVVFIIGDFTAQIGDPSGRDQTRPALSEQEVKKNAETFTEQAFMVLDADRTEVVYNSEWLNELGTEGLLKLASRMTVARMLERDDFSKRFEQNNSIRIHEFLYPLLQGKDSVEIESGIELGGTDQKFNLLVGRQLQKEAGQEPQLIGTLPILPGTDGEMKMSKTYDNHIPLDDPPQQMYGKLMSVPDYLIMPYLRLLTRLKEEEIHKIESELRIVENPKPLKKRMADAVVTCIKGKEAVQTGRDYFERTVEQGNQPEPDEMETITVSGDEIWIVDLLDESGLVESRGQAKRLLKQGGVYLDGDRLEGFDHDIPLDREYTLKVGKHKFRRIHPE